MPVHRKVPMYFRATNQPLWAWLVSFIDMKKILLSIGFIILGLFIGGFLVMKLTPTFGGSIKGERLKRVMASPNYKNGVFQNPIPTRMQQENVSFVKIMREFLRDEKSRIPQQSIPVVKINKQDFNKTNKGIRTNWLGHSSLLFEIDGTTILTDPVFSERTSPFTWMGTKRFEYTYQYDVKDLPTPDVIIISHDHYDHLDYATIMKFKKLNVHFVMPLGVGAHFDRWGFSPDRYTELDWWQEYQINGLTITATPSRHFTGRGLSDRFKTLWASWAIKNNQHSVFFSGDSGYFPGFKEIGKKLGPFDLCAIECGQYNEAWPYIHMAPEESVQAFIDLQGKLLLPIHWAKFKLSLHSWQEPIDRALKAAKEQNCTVTTPRIGEQIRIGEYTPQECWWNKI